SSSVTNRNTRGCNRSRDLEQYIQRHGKVAINIPSELNRLVGDHHSWLTREIGILIRHHADMKVESWKGITGQQKEELYLRLKEKFELNLEDSATRCCLEGLFSSRYKDFRSKCHHHYKMLGGGERGRGKPYKEFSMEGQQEEWLWLCDHFDKEAFQKRSIIASTNRSKLKTIHRMGTKTLVAHQHDLRCGPIELYKEAYTSHSSRTWASEEAQSNYLIMGDQKIHGFLRIATLASSGWLLCLPQFTPIPPATCTQLLKQQRERPAPCEFSKVEFLRLLSAHPVEWRWERMVQMQQQSTIESDSPIVEDDICAEVLGRTSGYIRGRGHGPKPPQRDRATFSSQPTVREKQLEQEVGSLRDQLEDQQRKIDFLMTLMNGNNIPPTSSW
ncbi:hypothetical protein Taro_049840, partial [Colocasia esculenta]|nr:hypothetical protein [Colocasia esculenta]